MPDVFPANIPVVLRFHRAPSNYLLLKKTAKINCQIVGESEFEDIDFAFNDPVIELQEPILEAFYAYSTELEARMHTGLYNKQISYLDYQARREVLDTGLQNYQISLHTGGKFPKYLLFALSNLDRLGGDDSLSLTKFTQNDLASIDLLVDQESILDFPLNGIGLAAVPHYQLFLKSTNRFCNPWSSGKLPKYFLKTDINLPFQAF